MPNLGNNLGANGIKMKWYSIQMLNRIPEVELERKLNTIGRLYAAIKREMRMEEGELWQFLFENFNTIQKSLGAFPENDVINGTVNVVQKLKEKEEGTPPYSEVYRQFIIFKANTTAKLFGKHTLPKRPRYKDLYRSLDAPKRNNDNSVKALLAKFHYEQEQHEKLLLVLNAPGIEITDFDALSARRLSNKRPSVIRASPKHKREFTTGDIQDKEQRLENDAEKYSTLHKIQSNDDNMFNQSGLENDTFRGADQTPIENTTKMQSGLMKDSNELSRDIIPVLERDKNIKSTNDEPSFSKSLDLPQLGNVFLTVPVHQLESESRPPLQTDNQYKIKKRGSKGVLKLPKVEE